jgi:plastocyanin
MFPAPAVDAAPVSGVVLRPPAPQKVRTEVNRYRGRDAGSPRNDGVAGAAGCQCNPGEYAVVHLTGDVLPAARLPMAPPTMAQKDRMFEPSVVAIPVGGAVSFPNRDPFFHNVFSYSRTRSFDLGRYPEGETHEVIFEEAGIVPVFCEIHYSMRAYIHVLDTPYFAVSDLSRRFRIPDVAPGDYTLHVWQENLPEIAMPITVGSDSIEIEVR